MIVSVLCIFSKWNWVRFTPQYLDGRSHDCTIIMLLFAVSVFYSLFFSYFHSYHAFFSPSLHQCMCVQFVIQTIGREMISPDRVNKSCECGTMNIHTDTGIQRMKKYSTHTKKLLRESRLTWKNSSRNIWIEICVNGCECECECVQPTKITTCSIA